MAARSQDEKNKNTESLKSLVLLMTLRCPLECAHCVVESNPRRREELDIETMRQLIREGKQLGVQTLGLTGGEPMLNPKLVYNLHSLATSLGMKTIMITSAFFAVTKARAIALLEPLADLHLLGLSTDSYHQDFVGVDRIRHAIAASHELGISKVELQVAHTGAPDIVRKLKSRLGDEGDLVTVREQKVWPVAQGIDLCRADSGYLVPIDELDLRCPMVGPVVTPDHRVHACCSALLNLKQADPLVLGNVQQESLKTIWTKATCNPYYNSIRKSGLRPLVTLLKAGGMVEQLDEKYVDVCHLCHSIHKNTKLTDFLRSSVAALVGVFPSDILGKNQECEE